MSKLHRKGIGFGLSRLRLMCVSLSSFLRFCTSSAFELIAVLECFLGYLLIVLSARKKGLHLALDVLHIFTRVFILHSTALFNIESYCALLSCTKSIGHIVLFLRSVVLLCLLVWSDLVNWIV